MSRLLLDTNVLVSFLTDRDPKQQERAAELFAAAARGESLILLHQAVISELVFVLTNLYDQRVEAASAIVRDLLAMPGVETVDALSWPRVLDLWPNRLRDFADAVLLAASLSLRCDGVATFDRRLARVAGALGVSSYW